MQVGYAVALRSLGVGHNRLTSLPAEVALLTRLTWLGLDGNPLILPTARPSPCPASHPPRAYAPAGVGPAAARLTCCKKKQFFNATRSCFPAL
jgi:hypothetical protein